MCAEGMEVGLKREADLVVEREGYWAWEGVDWWRSLAGLDGWMDGGFRVMNVMNEFGITVITAMGSIVLPSHVNIYLQ